MIFATAHIVTVADLIVNEGVSAIYILNLFITVMPWVLTFSIPFSILSAVLLAFGRLASDNEIIALKASGVSLFKIASPVLTTALMVSLFCIPLNDRLLPSFEYNSRKLIKKIGVSSPLALLEPGVIVRDFKDYVIWVSSKDKNTIKDIRIYQKEKNKPTRVIVAEEGVVEPVVGTGTVNLKLVNGSIDESLPQDPDNPVKVVFNTYQVSLDLKEAFKEEQIERKPREMSISELRDKIEHLIEIERGHDQLRTITRCYIEIHKKLALAFSSIIFALIGIPIALRMHRREKSINFGLTLALFLIYWSIMLGGVAFTIRQIVPPWLGIWSANIILFLIGITLFLRIARK